MVNSFHYDMFIKRVYRTPGPKQLSMNMAFFGNRVFTGVVKLRWGNRVSPNPTQLVPLQERKFHKMTLTETEWSRKPRFTKDCRPTRPQEEKKRSSICWHLYFPPLASELQKLWFLWFSATWFVLLCYSSPRNQIYFLTQFRVYFIEKKKHAYTQTMTKYFSYWKDTNSLLSYWKAAKWQLVLMASQPVFVIYRLKSCRGIHSLPPTFSIPFLSECSTIPPWWKYASASWLRSDLEQHEATWKLTLSSLGTPRT